MSVRKNCFRRKLSRAPSRVRRAVPRRQLFVAAPSVRRPGSSAAAGAQMKATTRFFVASCVRGRPPPSARRCTDKTGQTNFCIIAGEITDTHVHTHTHARARAHNAQRNETEDDGNRERQRSKSETKSRSVASIDGRAGRMRNEV